VVTAQSSISWPLNIPAWEKFKRWCEDRKARRMRRQEERDEQRRLDRIEREKKRSSRIKTRQLRRESRHCARAIQRRLTQLDFAHRSRMTRDRRRVRVAQVRFAQATVTPSRVFLRINTAKLPRGRGITSEALMDPEVIQELQLAVSAPVEAYRHYETGFWYIIDLGGKVSAIPNIVDRRDVISQMPKTAGPLDVPFGLGSHKKFYHVDLAKLPHLLIAGATGFGKSVFLHNILTYMLGHATADQVRVALVDLKGGAELSRYRNVPHLLELQRGDLKIERRVYTRRESVLDVLRAISYEVEWRLQRFAEQDISELSTWNFKNHAARMPRIVVVIDEIQNVMLDRGERAEVERTLIDIASRSRAVGIHLVVATQRPDATVITPLIKANFPARVAFNCFSIYDSKVILDNTAAAGLGRPGLLVFQGEGNRQFKCQSAYLTEGIIKDVITEINNGVEGVVEITRDVGRLDLIRWAIEDNDGKFTIDEVYNQFRERGLTYAEVRDIWAEFAVKKNSVEMDGKFYAWQKRDSTFVEVTAEGEIVPAVTIEDMVRWALAEHDGAFSVRKVYRKFKRDLTKSYVENLAREYEGQTVEVDNVVYRLDPGSSRAPRKWNAIDSRPASRVPG
jgi:hypothetical protein